MQTKGQFAAQQLGTEKWRLIKKWSGVSQFNKTQITKNNHNQLIMISVNMPLICGVVART
jgi:hypothetical protein